jgi:hypothetical protein
MEESSILNQASKELFVQFLYRAYVEIEGCFIGNFSKVKILKLAQVIN